ncbi:hypothetical protein LZK98_16365 [Sphingomonas cannabina]|uniref:hypothetical protein n=1 Tax=Sphingomonas cannabina TaxID=2899123 RepID=UPI001F15CB5D|nr:hypothetical protein [Sphingomonas cannabina]UIJ44618.1 hypothetical protein LZK98_16365 [Sphingomonas cannabina]
MTNLYRPEFEAALRVFARVSEAMLREGHEAPILVGGAAVELYSGSAITTGDFDVVTGRQQAFEQALVQQGFVRPSGPGHSFTGWIHPDLKLGFEVVSATLLDGLADRDRVRLITLQPDGTAAVLAVEDMIADRMGQFASGTAPEMLEQARVLLSLHPDLDRAYLERRIREETSNEHGIATLAP